MSQMLFIRSHNWGDAEKRVFQQMKGYFGTNIALTFDATRASPPEDLPVRVTAITPQKLEQLGLSAPQDWGWRCGDFFYYAGVHDFPGYDHYWLIEPDVVFNKVDISNFFKKFATRSEDLLACYIGPRDDKWKHHTPAKAYFEKVYGCIFPLTRLSARAIDMLKVSRCTHTSTPEDNSSYVNDEAFVASALCQSPEYTHASLNAITPKLLTVKSFNTAMIYLEAECPNLPPGIYHPVMSPEEFSRKIHKKIGVRSSFDHYSPRFRNFLSGSDNDKFYSTMLRRISRDHAAPYRVDRNLPPIRAEKTNFPHSIIVEKRPKPPRERARPDDFKVSPPTYTEKIDLEKLAPYYWSVENDQIIFVDSAPPLASHNAPVSRSQQKAAYVVATPTVAKLREYLSEKDLTEPIFILTRGTYRSQELFESLKSLHIPAYLSCHAIDGISAAPGGKASENTVSAVQAIVKALAIHGGRASVAIGIDTEVAGDPGLYLRAFPRARMVFVEHPTALWVKWCVSDLKCSAEQVVARLGSTLQFLEACREATAGDATVRTLPFENLQDSLRAMLEGVWTGGPADNSLPPARRTPLPDWLAERIDRDTLTARLTAVRLLVD